MKAVIVDDEPKARKVLHHFVHECCPEIELVAEADSVPAAVREIHSHQPNLVFLDIDMPVQNGFALFDYFEEITFQVVFVTASRDHALDAFRVSALDYILKPINPDQLKESVEKAKQSHSENLKERISMLNERMSGDGEISRIALSTSEMVEFVKLTDILYLEADGPYTEFHLTDGRSVVVSKSMSEYQLLEQQPAFFKSHRSFIVNLSKVSRFKKEDGGFIVMENGDELSLSRYRKKEFLKAMGM